MAGKKLGLILLLCGCALLSYGIHDECFFSPARTDYDGWAWRSNATEGRGAEHLSPHIVPTVLLQKAVGEKAASDPGVFVPSHAAATTSLNVKVATAIDEDSHFVQLSSSIAVTQLSGGETYALEAPGTNAAFFPTAGVKK